MHLPLVLCTIYSYKAPYIRSHNWFYAPYTIIHLHTTYLVLCNIYLHLSIYPSSYLVLSTITTMVLCTTLFGIMHHFIWYYTLLYLVLCTNIYMVLCTTYILLCTTIYGIMHHYIWFCTILFGIMHHYTWY